MLKRFLLAASLALISSIHVFSQKTIDSLETRLQEKLNAGERISTLSELCWQYRRVDQAKAIAYGTQAVKLASEISDKKGLSNSLNDLAIIYMDRTELDSAITLLNQALDIRKELHDSTGQAAIYNKLGIIYQNRLDLSAALSNALKALEIYEQLDMQPHVRTIMNNIGIIHYNMRNYDKSLEIHSALLKLRTDAGDQYGIAQTLLNIGNVVIAKGDTLGGMKHYKEASETFRKLDKKEELAVVLNNLGAYYNVKKNYSEARTLLDESLSIRRGLNNPKEICSTLIMLGELNGATGKYALAKTQLHEALAISKAFDLPLERSAYQKLAAIFKNLKNADSVFYYYQKYDAMNTQLYESNLKNEVAELQTKYETEKKERAIASLSNQNTIQQLLLSRQRLFFMGGIIVLIVLGFSAWQFQRIKRFKERIQHERKLKEEQERAARAVITTEVNERRRIAAELHDGVIQTFAAAKLNLSRFSQDGDMVNTGQQSAYNNVIALIDEGCAELRTISHTMMPEVLSKKGLPDALRDLVKRIDHSVMDIHLAMNGLTQRLDPAIESSVYRIIQECISNTLKHAKATRMDIQLTVEPTELNLSIEDNGVGFDPSRATSSQGIGLQNIRSRVSLLSGHIEIDAAPGKGVAWTIVLPLAVLSIPELVEES